jgi:O-acetyl-ADP-ribose deacetylase (regulator of RNase III)
MPIKFISLNEEFIELAKLKGYESYLMKIQDYKPERKTYYVSPANSLGFMDGGIDMALSRIVFPGIEPIVKARIKNQNMTNLLGRNYLPIGSSIIIDYDDNRSMVVAPTMLLPQDVSKTRNAYYATMAVLFNVLCNRKESIENVDIILTSMCCGYGKMPNKTSLNQILKAIEDYPNYRPNWVKNQWVILHQPNLMEQPKLYQNTEWFIIPPQEIVM